MSLGVTWYQQNALETTPPPSRLTKLQKLKIVWQ
ncbi:unnamed protein product [Lathyrus sativus]|nr:unnamed protein product [Lathyrus sativus]